MTQEIVMPGATRESFITGWTEQWFKHNANGPTFAQVVNALDGIVNGWHRVICSTPPEYLTTPGLASDIYRAACVAEANSNPVIKAIHLMAVGRA